MKGAKLIYIRKLYGQQISPNDIVSASYFESLKDGAVVELKPLSGVRCPGLHRKYFSMLHTAWENVPENFDYRSFEAFRKAVQVAAGFFEPVHCWIEGEYIEQRFPVSIAYQALNNDQFKELYDKVNFVLCEKYNMNTESFIMQYA